MPFDARRRVLPDNSALVKDLPAPSKKRVKEETGIRDGKVICFSCIRGCAFDWGFPRVERTSVTKGCGVGAVWNFSCDERGKLFTVMLTHQGIDTYVARIRSE